MNKQKKPDKRMHKWTAPPVVVKDGAPLVPFNHYLEAVDEIQRIDRKSVV